MSAAYNQVPRLSTGPKMLGRQPHDQMQHDGGTQPAPAPFAADRHHPNAKQRKWRVLVSIGLLLPALAAIIGIVAWTISIEVSSDHQQGPVSMAQRRSERAQMEQFRRDEARALAALVAARRSARHSHTLAATGSAPHSHQPQPQPQSSERAPEPAAGVEVAKPSKAQRFVMPTTRPTRSSQPQQQQATSNSKQQQHQMSKNSGESSSTMPKHLDQSDTLSNESSENQEPTASASSQAASFGEDDEPAAGKPIEEANTRTQQTDSEAAPEAPRNADEQTEQRPVEVPETRDEPSESRVDAEPASVQRPRQNNADALKESKSRWLSGKRPSVSSTDSSAAPVVTRKLASAKHNHSRARAHKGKQQETPKSAKTNSKYTLLSEPALAAENKRDEDDDQRSSASALAPSQPAESESDERQADSSTISTTSTTTTTQPSASDCHERAEQQSRAKKPAAEEDEDISFEAIASAISKTLSADQQPAEGKSRESAEQTGDSPNAPSEAAESSAEAQEDAIGIEGPGSDSAQAELAPSTQKRRRTTGEHLAEVIDHLVDRRKQQQHEGSRFGDRAASLNEQERSQEGPQIVVVAPVGPSGALLKARSLTKAEETPVASSSGAPIKTALSTKAGATKSSGPKKGVEALKKQPAEAKGARPIGGRLIGVGPSADSPANYSERVELIEDDDSSSLLLPPKSASDQSALEHEHVASIHVSSHSGEPRFRSPRHELGSSQMFERYAPLVQSFNEQPGARQAERHATPQNNGEAKLYSAEQLIRSHILRSKNNKPAATSQQQQRRPIVREETKPKHEEATSTQSSVEGGSSTQSSTSARPPTSSRAPELPANRQQQREQEVMMAQQSQQQPSGQFSSSVQSVAVPAFFMQQAPLSPLQPTQQQQQQQQFIKPLEAFQAMESQQQQVRVQPSAGQREYFRPEQQQPADSQLQQHQVQPIQMQQPLPTFADQEIQVPAHLAESVIRDLQQSASSVTGLLHGQPMVFQALPPGQQPVLPAQFFQSPAQESYHRINAMMPPARQQFHAAESQQRAQYAQASRGQPESQSAAGSGGSSYSLNPFALVSRLVGGRRQQSDQQKRKEAQDRQALANRDSAPKEQQAQPAEEEPRKSSRFIGTVKSFGPRSLVQPVAQMALKQFLSSIGDNAESLERQAAAQQAAAEAAEMAASQQHQHQPLAATQQQRSSAAQMGQQARPADAMQTSGSSPIGMAALPPPGQREQLAASASGRSMRSLPIGAQAPQVNPHFGDQEVQESYGQMPAYHMPERHYGGAHYESPDKKSKGVTFHFGGGPIGGGTQLITSPMGIFKHLMLPLMPSPEIHLNGKVVFGLVLEKTTKVGAPPKKKHKYWGR